MKKLRLGRDLALPLDWVQLATVVYGARGSGKTSLGRRAAEEAHKLGQRFCAIDLKGDWWGLKSSADGKSAGLPVVIFGGDHGDLPLEEGAGAFVAETVAGLGQSTILDLEHFSKGKQVRFLAQFFDRLYDANRENLLLLLDESQRYAPQARMMDPESAKCLGAVEDLVKLGRKHGIGPVLFTQRGSSLNKEVSELCDMLVAFRTPGPLDQARVKDWLDANTTKAERDAVMDKLSGLPTGTAVFASGHPELKTFGVYAIDRPETFDSSATPKPGQRRVEPKKLAAPDLKELRERMAQAIERAKADDPRELRRRIAELEKQLAAKPVPPPPPPAPVIDKKTLQQLDRALKNLDTTYSDIDSTQKNVATQLSTLQGIGNTLQKALESLKGPPHGGLKVSDFVPTFPAQRTRLNGKSNGTADPSLKAMHRAMLTALAQHPRGLTKRKILIHTGYAASGPVSTAFADLGRSGFVQVQGNELVVTNEGLTALGPFTPLPVGAALREWLLGGEKLSTMEKALLRVVCNHYPKAVRKNEILSEAGYAASGPVSSAFAKLVAYGYAVAEGVGALRAAEELFS